MRPLSLVYRHVNGNASESDLRRYRVHDPWLMGRVSGTSPTGVKGRRGVGNLLIEPESFPGVMIPSKAVMFVVTATLSGEAWTGYRGRRT